MPDSDYIRFDVGTAAEKAKQIVMTACENFKNRKPDLVYIPDMKQKATVGYSLEALVKVLDGVTNSPVSYTHLDVYKRQVFRQLQIWLESRLLLQATL